MKNIKLKGFLIRFLFSLILVLSTYNPTSFSYIDWLMSVIETKNNIPLVLLVGVALVIGWIIYLRATLRSLGPIGVGLATAFFACIIWLLVDLGILHLNKFATVAWVILIITAIVLAIGMSWSLIRRKISGQADVDDVDQ